MLNDERRKIASIHRISILAKCKEMKNWWWW